MTTLETALRGGSISILLVFSILCYRFRREFQPLTYAAPYSLCSAAYVYVSAWPIPDRMVLLDAMASGLVCSIPALFWLLMASLFDDGFVPSLRKRSALAGLFTLGVAESLTHWHRAWLVNGYFAAAVGFFIAGSARAVLGFKDDLIQGRRQFRIAVLFFAPLHGFAVVAAEFLLPGVSLAEGGRTLNSWAIALSSCIIAILFLKPHPLMALSRRDDMTFIATARQDDPRDKALLDKLNGIMTGERLYRDDGLSVAGLAKRMDIGENRLRRLINTQLGHRNFSSFVNGYRLADAAAALGDPDQAEVPILTIALDAGFGSIGPFNRAFKADTGLTPREFRNTRLGRISASSGENSARSDFSL